MSYRIDLHADLGEEIRRIATEQTDKALRESGRSAALHEAIHQVRKRAKKVRALLRLVRDAHPDLYDRDNAALRDLARPLSEVRDAKAYVETCDLLAEHVLPSGRDALSRLRRRLVARCEAQTSQLDAARRLAGARDELSALRIRVERWRLDALGIEHLVAGASRTFGRARARYGKVDGPRDVATLHQLRKRCKYLRFHHRLLRGLWDGPMQAMRKEARALAKLLGDHHDLALLRERLASLEIGEEVAVPARLAIGRRSRAVYAEAMEIGKRMYCEKKKTFASRLQTYAGVTREPIAAPGQGDVRLWICV